MKNKLPKTLILIRHAESEKNKNNPLRSLTSRGKLQAQKAATALSLLVSGSVEIISTTTPRTMETGKILSKILTVPFDKTFENLRVENINELGNSSENLTLIYFKKYKENSLPKNLPTPSEIVRRFIKAISQIECDTLIIVGHSGALETFASFQKNYKFNGPISDELNYAEFLVLNKKG